MHHECPAGRADRTLENCDSPPDTGFELGHVDLECEGAIYSSRDRGSAGLVMIYLAAADLLHGVRTLLGHPDGSYVFVGSGSSWSFAVQRTRRRGLQVTTPAGALIGVVSEADYWNAIWNAVQQLIRDRPPAEGAAGTDLTAAMDSYPAEPNPL